ncbi:hypothetical protein ACWCYZ_46805, partial [Streptomyces virginiae]
RPELRRLRAGRQQGGDLRAPHDPARRDDRERRVLRTVPEPAARTGLGRVVRAQRDYWAGAGMTGPAWPALATLLEDEVLAR